MSVAQVSTSRSTSRSSASHRSVGGCHSLRVAWPDARSVGRSAVVDRENAKANAPRESDVTAQLPAKKRRTDRISAGSILAPRRSPARGRFGSAEDAGGAAFLFLRLLLVAPRRNDDLRSLGEGAPFDHGL